MKAILVVFAIFAVYQCAANSLRVQCPTDWPCASDYVFIHHPCNCRSYYVCLGGFEPIPMLCPEELHFNDDTKKCDTMHAAHCKPDPQC